MRQERNYQLRWINGQLEVEVIHAKLDFSNIEVLGMYPLMYESRHVWISGVCKDKNAVVMKVGVSKDKENLKVNRRTLVPLRNI